MTKQEPDNVKIGSHYMSAEDIKYFKDLWGTEYDFGIDRGR